MHLVCSCCHICVRLYATSWLKPFLFSTCSIVGSRQLFWLQDRFCSGTFPMHHVLQEYIQSSVSISWGFSWHYKTPSSPTRTEWTLSCVSSTWPHVSTHTNTYANSSFSQCVLTYRSWISQSFSHVSHAIHQLAFPANASPQSFPLLGHTRSDATLTWQHHSCASRTSCESFQGTCSDSVSVSCPLRRPLCCRIPSTKSTFRWHSWCSLQSVSVAW